MAPDPASIARPPGWRRLAGEGMRMALLSLASLVLGYLLTAAMTELCGFDPKLAYGIAIMLCTVLNFFGCRHYVFRGAPGPLWREAAAFFPSVLLFRAMEVVLFSMLLSLLDNYHVAYFATAIVSMAGKLLVSKFLVFRRRSH